jgi:two-component system phosphate regulon sensor histidine kinase PhoR
VVNQLKTLEQQQKTFIGNVSHEFKTPLSVILAYTDLVDMYQDDPALLEDANRKIKNEAKRLFEMVERVLYSASLEKYDFESNKESIEVKTILKAVCERVQGKAQRFQVHIQTNLQEATIWAERESFIYILINLLDNAIKYNQPQGKIVVHSETHSDTIEICIRDTGIGIPDELKEKVFEPFFTVHKDRSRKSGGTGLGLALVKQLVEKQKGTITLTNAEEQGTEVALIFPLQKNVTSPKQL